MKIKRISLENVTVSPHSGAHVATVLLKADTASLSLRASAMLTVVLGDRTGDDIVARALVQDALRQVRRMPEYRDAPQSIEVDESAWPRFAKQA